MAQESRTMLLFDPNTFIVHTYGKSIFFAQDHEENFWCAHVQVLLINIFSKDKHFIKLFTVKVGGATDKEQICITDTVFHNLLHFISACKGFFCPGKLKSLQARKMRSRKQCHSRWWRVTRGNHISKSDCKNLVAAPVCLSAWFRGEKLEVKDSTTKLGKAYH